MFDLELFSIAPLVLVLASLMDLLVGDPELLPHPIRWIGKPIETVDGYRCRIPVSDGLLGLLVGVVYPTTIGFSVVGLLAFTRFYSGVLFTVVSAILLWSALSVRSLYGAGRCVLDALRQGDLPAAREAVGRMVGRKTDSMNDEQISRAGVESVAEGFLDGVASPLFWTLVGGIPGVMVYKTINTLDSMIGYRSNRYREFGRVSARLDDGMNWVPARLTLLLVPVASLLAGGSVKRSLRVGVADRNAHPSPNAGHPEAAFAGALGCKLGGKTEYDGYNEIKPYLNENAQSAGTSNLEQSLHLFVAVVGLTEIICLSFLLLL